MLVRHYRHGRGGGNIIVLASAPLLELQGQNILFRVSSGACLEGAYSPPDMIHQGHMPLMPNGSTRLCVYLHNIHLIYSF